MSGSVPVVSKYISTTTPCPERTAPPGKLDLSPDSGDVLNGRPLRRCGPCLASVKKILSLAVAGGRNIPLFPHIPRSGSGRGT